MTKAEIVSRVVATTRFSVNEAFDLVEQVLELVKAKLVAGEDVKVRKFGTFKVIHMNDRPGRNPHTGEEVTVTARRVVHFRASDFLKQGINCCNSGLLAVKGGGLPGAEREGDVGEAINQATRQQEGLSLNASAQPQCRRLFG